MASSAAPSRTVASYPTDLPNVPSAAVRFPAIRSYEQVDRETGGRDRPAHGDHPLRGHAQARLEGFEHVEELVIEPFDDRPQHVATLDEIAEPHKGTQRAGVKDRGVLFVFISTADGAGDAKAAEGWIIGQA